MTKPLIVGIDGSDPSLRAVDWAVREAVRRDVPLRLVHASLGERYEPMPPGLRTGRLSEQVLAEQIAACAAQRASLIDPRVRVSTAVAGREPVAALLAEADRAGAIVVGNRGRGDLAGMLLGSTGLGVAARAACPVIVVRGGMRASDTGFGTVTVGVGDPGTCSAAVGFALAEADARDAELVAVHAWRRPARALPGGGESGGAAGDGKGGDGGSGGAAGDREGGGGGRVAGPPRRRAGGRSRGRAAATSARPNGCWATPCCRPPRATRRSRCTAGRRKGGPDLSCSTPRGPAT